MSTQRKTLAFQVVLIALATVTVAGVVVMVADLMQTNKALRAELAAKPAAVAAPVKVVPTRPLDATAPKIGNIAHVSAGAPEWRYRRLTQVDNCSITVFTYKGREHLLTTSKPGNTEKVCALVPAGGR